MCRPGVVQFQTCLYAVLDDFEEEGNFEVRTRNLDAQKIRFHPAKRHRDPASVCGHYFLGEDQLVSQYQRLLVDLL